MISFRTIYRTSFMSYLRYNDFHRIWLNFSLNDLWCLLISVLNSMWSTKWLILVSWFYKNLKVCIRFESTLIFQCSYDSFWYFHRKSCKDHFCFSYSCCSTELLSQFQRQILQKMKIRNQISIQYEWRTVERLLSCDNTIVNYLCLKSICFCLISHFFVDSGSISAAPENITVTFLNPTSVKISWQTSVDQHAIPVDKYDVTYKPTDAR